MQLLILTLQRLIWATSLVVAVGLFPQQGQATPAKDTSPKLSLGEDATIRDPCRLHRREVKVMMTAENLTEALVAGERIRC